MPKQIVTILFVVLILAVNASMATAGRRENFVEAFVYNEHKGDGVFNQQDYGTHGFNICLEDQDSQIVGKMSGVDGEVIFDSIQNGKYTVTQKLSEKQKHAGWNAEPPKGASAYSVVVNDNGVTYFLSGKRVEQAVFGNRLAEIHGHTTYDLNGNGLYELSEPFLGQWQIYLDLNNNKKLDNPQFWTGCTDKESILECLPKNSEPYLCSSWLDGSWHMRQIPDGTYSVRIVPRDGWKTTGQESYDLSARGDQHVVWSEFSLQKVNGNYEEEDTKQGDCKDLNDTHKSYKAVSEIATPLPSATPTAVEQTSHEFTLPERFINYLRNLINNLVSGK